MPSRSFSLLAVLLAAGLLSGCAADRNAYPSLARRDSERLHGTMPVAPSESPAPPAQTALSAELVTQLEQLVGQAEAAQGRFAARVPQARQLTQAAAGAAPGSERWSVAAIAFADLESARSDAMIALAELDLLFARAMVDGTVIAPISNAREQVIRLVAEQDRVLAVLRVG